MEQNGFIILKNFSRWSIQALLFFFVGWVIYAIPYWATIVSLIQTDERLIVGKDFDLIYNGVTMLLYGMLACLFLNRKALVRRQKSYKKSRMFYMKLINQFVIAAMLFWVSLIKELYYVVYDIIRNNLMEKVYNGGVYTIDYIMNFLGLPDPWTIIWISLAGLVYVIVQFFFVEEAASNLGGGIKEIANK